MARQRKGLSPRTALRPNGRWRRWGAWTFLLLLYVVLRANLLGVPLDRDEGAFGLIAQGLWRGELPYRDWCDLKPPGVFYIYALGLGVFPASAQGVHFFLLLWNLATLFVVASLGGALGGRRAAWWTGFFYALVSSAMSVQGFTAGSEMLALLPMAGSVRLAVAARKMVGRRRAAILLASGACGAFACWTKQPMAMSLLIVPLYFLSEGRMGVPPVLARDRQDACPTASGWRRFVALCRDAAWWLGGGALASLLVCAPFLATGAVKEMFYWSFTHGYLYSKLASFDPLALFGQRLLALAPDYLLVFLLALGTAAWAAWRRRAGWWLGLGFLLLSLLGACHTGFMYPHYFAQLVPALALAAGVGVAWALDTGETLAPKGRAWRWGFGLLALAGPLVLLLALRRDYYFTVRPADISNRMLGPQGFSASPELARYLRDHMEADQWLFIYGSEPQVAFLARRRLANPYVMMYPLTWPLPRHRESQERTWRMIEAKQPAYIVVVWTPLSVLPQEKTDPFFEHQLMAYVRAGYVPEAVLARAPAGEYCWVAAPSEEFIQKHRDALVYVVWRRSPAAGGAGRGGG